MIRFLTRAEKILSLVLVFIILLTGFYLVRRFVVDNSLLIPDIGGIHTEGVVGRPQYLNPILSVPNPVDRDITQLIFSGLSRFNPHSGLIEDDIATSDISPDHLKYTFTILPDATWHDGTPVTADDILYTYRDVLQHESFRQNPLSQAFSDVKISKLTERSVQFSLSKPYSFFLANVTLGLLPKHVLGVVPVENLSESEFNLSPIGSGPYQFANWQLNGDTSEVTLKRYDAYYGTPPKLETVIIRAFPDQDALLLGENTLTGFRLFSQGTPEEFFPDSQRLTFYSYRLPQYTALFLNTESPSLSNKKVRFALLLATNKDSLTELLPDAEIVDTPILESKENLDIEYSLERSRGAFFDTEWNLPSKAVPSPSDDPDDASGGPVYDEKVTAAEELSFQITATADAWISLRLDGVAQPSFLMKAGTERSYETSNSLSFTTIGNAGGVKVSVNGLPLKSLGGNGVVLRNIVLDRLTLSQYIDETVEESVAPADLSENTPAPVTETDGPVLEDEADPVPEVVDPLPPPVTDQTELEKVRVNADGQRLILRLVTAQDPPVFLEIAEMVQEQWLEAGAKVVIETYPLPELQKKIQERDYDVLLFGQNLGYNLDAFPFWHSSQSGTGLNLSNYKSLEADNLLVSIRNSFDERSKDQILNRLKRVIAEDTPAIFLTNPSHYYALDTTLKNVQLNTLSSHSDRLTDLSNWYIKNDYQLKEDITFSLLLRWIFGL